MEQTPEISIPASPAKTNFRTILFSVFILGLILGGIVVWMFLVPVSQFVATDVSQNETQDFQFVFKTVPNPCFISEPCKASLVRMDASGKQEVIEEDLLIPLRVYLKSALNISDTSRFLLNELYFPKNADKIFFTTYAGSFLRVIAYDTTNHQFNLSNNGYQVGEQSPDGSKMALLDQGGRELQVLDIVPNNLSVVAQAEEGTTFARNYNGSDGEPLGDIVWQGSCISYGVFKAPAIDSVIPTPPNESNPRVDTRQVCL